MNDINEKKLTMLANELSEKALLVELANRLDDDELGNMLDNIANCRNMMLTEDGNELYTCYWGMVSTEDGKNVYALNTKIIQSI